MAKEVSDNNRLKEARLWNVFRTDQYFSSLIGARFPVRRKKKTNFETSNPILHYGYLTIECILLKN